MSAIVRIAEVALPYNGQHFATWALQHHPRPDRLDKLCMAGLAAVDALFKSTPHTLIDMRATPHVVIGSSTYGCLDTDHAYYEQVTRCGIAQGNPRVFAYTLPNIVLGEIAITFKLPGEQLFIAATNPYMAAQREAEFFLVNQIVQTALIVAVDVPFYADSPTTSVRCAIWQTTSTHSKTQNKLDSTDNLSI